MKNNNRKQEIINSCINLICEKEFDLSSMQAIANEVGLSKATLYFYFDSKETLLREVYEYCHKMDVDACNKGIDEVENAVDKLCKRFANIVEHTIKHPKEAQVELLYDTSPMYIKHYGDREDFLKDITKIMKYGIEKSEIKNMPEWLLAEFYFGMSQAMYLKFKNNPELWAIDEIRNDCFKIIKDTFTR